MWVAYLIFGLLLVTIFFLYRRSNFLNFRGLFKNRKLTSKLNNYKFKSENNLTLDQQYNSKKVDKQKEIDRILDKISRSGLKSLSKTERDFLDRYSNE